MPVPKEFPFKVDPRQSPEALLMEVEGYINELRRLISIQDGVIEGLNDRVDTLERNHG